MTQQAVAVANGKHEVATADQWGRDRVELLKRTICRGADDDEFALFLAQCKRTGLDPFARQIHAMKRWDDNLRREVMSIQVGIDGYRLVADRTGSYTPGREPTFAYDDAGRLVSATAFVKKLVAGQWHEIASTAFYDESVQTKKDGEPNKIWRTRPRNMLAKVAEALALRRAFPQELSGIYTDDEMPEADPPPTQPAQLSAQDAATILQLIEQTKSDAAKFCDHFHVADVDDLRPEQAKQAIAMLRKKLDAAKAKALPAPVEPPPASHTEAIYAQAKRLQWEEPDLVEYMANYGEYSHPDALPAHVAVIVLEKLTAMKE